MPFTLRVCERVTQACVEQHNTYTLLKAASTLFALKPLRMSTTALQMLPKGDLEHLKGKTKPND
jgi:hypothetical protein